MNAEHNPEDDYDKVFIHAFKLEIENQELKRKLEVVKAFVAAQDKLDSERPDFSDETFRAMAIAYGNLKAILEQ